MINKEDLYFKTNVQLKSIIGKDLINDDNIAILELVKNAFDADAKKVELQFLNIKENDDRYIDSLESYTEQTSRIIIKDDGVGMNLSDIKDKWLNIAYSEKKNNSRQHNRMMAGAKGVGRFSCDRLGEYLNLYSKQASSNDYIQILVDWKAFEIDDDINKEIQSVPIRYRILTVQDLIDTGIEPISKGVILEIIKLRSKWAYKNIDNNSFWNVDKLIDLKRYLEKLINPNQAFIENDFGIYLTAPEFVAENEIQKDYEKFIGKIDNRIFDTLDFKSTSVESEIIDGGKAIYTELKDRGRTIFWIKEKNEFYPEILNAKIVAYYLNPYAKAFFTRQTGMRPVEYGSIYLFINGFRIPPYGENGDDWLNLEQRRGQGYARFLSQRELVGRIEILDNENKFQIISSREGIVKNESFIKLTNQRNSYFFKTFRRLEKYVVDGLNWDSIPEEDRDKIQEIEKKIISGETTESDLNFREDEATKSRRIYSSIHSIISAKPDEVLELYINENLISEKIAEEREQSEREFEQLISDFENKKIDADILDKILQRKAAQNKELEKQIKEFSRYTTNELTSKAILDLQHFKNVIAKQEKIIFQLNERLKLADAEKEEKDAALRRAQAEVATVKEELKETLSQNLFLKSIKSQDLDEVISLMHHAGIYAQTIEAYLKNISLKLSYGIAITNDELKDIVKNISFEAKKILNISEFATKANFKLHTEYIDTDISEYFSEYINNIIPTVTDTDLLIGFNNKVKTKLIRHIKPIEVNILIDNLVNNAKKAKAKNIVINLSETPDNKSLVADFIDDGIGIPEKNLKSIFDFGFTTTNGSGIGLFHVKQIIDEMHGTITASNNLNEGATFKLII